jgi:hypothetical protein
MQIKRSATSESPTRARIEAYVLKHEEPDAEGRGEAAPMEQQLVDLQPPPPRAEAAVAQALDVLESCLDFPLEAGAELAFGAPDPLEEPKPKRSTDSETKLISPLAATPAIVDAPAPHAAAAQRMATVRVPRGLLLSLIVSATAISEWLATSSFYAVVVAALIASAAVNGAEIVLRAVNPPTARRLGLGRRRKALHLPFDTGLSLFPERLRTSRRLRYRIPRLMLLAISVLAGPFALVWLMLALTGQP